MPGASTREAIQRNHRLMTDECACAGAIAGNPVREDIEEAAALDGADRRQALRFILLPQLRAEHKRNNARPPADPDRLKREQDEAMRVLEATTPEM